MSKPSSLNPEELHFNVNGPFKVKKQHLCDICRFLEDTKSKKKSYFSPFWILPINFNLI